MSIKTFYLLFYNIVDFFIPENNNKSAIYIRQARILVSINLFFIVLALLLKCSLIFVESTNGFPFMGSIMLILAFLFFFKKKGSLLVSGNITAGHLYILLSYVTLKSGGLYSDDLLWMLLVPLISFLLTNKKTGIFWTLMLLGFVVYLFYLEKNSELSYLSQSLIQDSTYYFNSLFFLFITIIGVIYIYENEKSKFIKQLEHQHLILEKQQKELILQSKKLAEAKKLLEEYNKNLENKVVERTFSLAKANKELKRSNQDLEQFAYIASHDLQEPLRMVGNFVQLLKFEYSDKIDATGKNYIQFAVDGVTRMSVLIEELLQYSFLNKQNEKQQSVSIEAIIRKKILNLEPQIQLQKGEIHFHNLPPKMCCSPTQMGIVFYNLINNALKFNESSPPIIHISAEISEKNCLFRVADNGIGINKKYEYKVFEIFKRLHLKEEYEGTGIGLALCKKIVLQQGGSIWFESEVGKGTTFYFTIPIKKTKDN